MTLPMEYERASPEFETFMKDVIDESGLPTRHSAYTLVQGVFQTFRRRLEIQDAIRFANILPPILRAIFIADWNFDEPKRPFESLQQMTKEVQSLRAPHNFSPDTAIKDVAVALRKNIYQRDLDSLLSTFPEGAAKFWAV